MDSGRLAALCVAAWLAPGAGHAWLGRRRQAAVFVIVPPAMFVIGLALSGRMFPLTVAEPLVGLAALAQMGIGLVYVVAWALGLGSGVVTAVTYEYGNTFLIVAGLLNLLVIIDAYDVAVGRK